MENIPPKSDGDSYTSSEFNNVESQEPQNVIATAGLPFDPNNLTQLQEGQHIISSFSSSYNDSGVVNAYVLTQGSGFIITAYQEGLSCSFVTPNSNTGASTVNVNNLGIVPILNPDLSPLTGGEISSTYINRIAYRGGNFILATIDGLDVQLRNELASTTAPFGTTLVGSTNTSVESIMRRAYGRFDISVFNSTITSVNVYNISKAEMTINSGPPINTTVTLYFTAPMSTINYTVTVSTSIPGGSGVGFLWNIVTQTQNQLVLNALTVPAGISLSIYEYRP